MRSARKAASSATSAARTANRRGACARQRSGARSAQRAARTAHGSTWRTPRAPLPCAPFVPHRQPGPRCRCGLRPYACQRRAYLSARRAHGSPGCGPAGDLGTAVRAARAMVTASRLASFRLQRRRSHPLARRPDPRAARLQPPVRGPAVLPVADALLRGPEADRERPPLRPARSPWRTRRGRGRQPPGRRARPQQPDQSGLGEAPRERAAQGAGSSLCVCEHRAAGSARITPRSRSGWKAPQEKQAPSAPLSTGRRSYAPCSLPYSTVCGEVTVSDYVTGRRVRARFRVDCTSGNCYWSSVTGQAGTICDTRNGPVTGLVTGGM